MARALADHAEEVVSQALLSPNLVTNRQLKLGERLTELVRQRPTFKEGRLEDGTPTCPRIRLAVAEAPAPLPGLEQHKTVTWRVGGRDTQHVMLFLAAQEFQQHVQRDALASLLHAAEAARPGCRLHLLTYKSQSASVDDPAVRQLGADLAVWRPDVAFHCAKDLDAAAQHVYRMTRAVAEAQYKQTSTSSFISVELQTKDAQKKRVQLERLLARFEVPPDGSKSALMRTLLAVGAGAEEAYAAGDKYGSLQGLLEAVDRDGADATQAAVARLPLPASTSKQVGAAAAEKVVSLASLDS